MQTSSDPPLDAASQTPGFRSRVGLDNLVAGLTRWWTVEVAGTVDQAAVIEKRRAECEVTARYLLMTCMSAGIAILGMLLSSPAVVIGAMLLSPLMDPIMGVGFALAIGDSRWLRRAGRSLAVGVVLAILFCALIVVFSPIQTVTPEIAARTQPNLFDLLVAIFSAIAGAYAVIRGREGTIVGVAIATALMPPLAAVGYGFATLNLTVFSGALLLFVTNLTAIALTATAMARGYGFSTKLSIKQSQFQAFLIFAAFVALAVPLGLSLYRIGWEANTTRQINAIVNEVFDGQARVSDMEPHFDSDPYRVSATVLTPRLIDDAEERAAARIEEELGHPVEVSLDQLRVGTGALAREEAELSRFREREREEEREAETVAERLAILAGVEPEEVTVDRERQRALVTARPLDGAPLSVYRELEARIDATAPEWDIRIVPPLRALPSIAFDDEGEPTAEGRRAIRLIAWAQRRIGVPLVLRGPSEQAQTVREALADAGVEAGVEIVPIAAAGVEADWAMPDG